MANRRANVFLGFLLVTVVIGLGYYIGLPLWRAFADGTARTWQAQVAAAEADNAALDARRAAAVAALREALRLAPVRVRVGEGEGFRSPLALDGGGLVATGWNGTILRSGDAGATWDEVRASAGERFSTPLALDGGGLVAMGWSGTILRSGDGGATWDEVRASAGEDFSTALALKGGGLVATGESGTILRSGDGGATWDEVRAGAREGFDTPLALDGGGLVAMGSDGTILLLSDATAKRLVELPTAAGGAGDASLAGFVKALDVEVRDAGAVSAAFATLQGIAAERRPVEAGLARARKRLADWKSGVTAIEMRQAAFAAFMANCRAGAVEPTDAAVTTACLDAFAASEADTRRQWWEAVAEQAPAGILILFLLATLSGLYRYNVRLAGFHNGRADALELVVAGVDKELLTPVADALAADKVEFGAAKTPTDHAAEMATALINRTKP